MFERFTDIAREIMASANQEAQHYNHEHIDTGHILLAIVEKKRGMAYDILKSLSLKDLSSIDLEKIRSEFKNRIKPGSDVASTDKVRLQTSLVKKVIEYAIEQARSLNHSYVGSEHLLLGLFLTLSDGTELVPEEENIAKDILLSCGLTFKTVQVEALNLLEAVEKKKKKFKSARKKKQRPVKCKIFEFELNEEKIMEFLKTIEFVQATQSSLNLPNSTHSSKITIFYRDRE